MHKNDTPNPQTLTAWRTWLRAHGFSASQAAAVVKSARNAGDVGADIRAWLHGRGKAAK